MMRAKTINFTKDTLRRLPAAEKGKRDWHSDAKEPGLQLMVTAAGTKTFYLDRKIDGAHERIRIGPFPDVSIDQARAQVAEWRSQIVKGENPKDGRRGAKGELTLQQAFDCYLDRHLKPRRKRPDDIQKQFERVKPAIKNRKLSLVTYHAAQQLHEDIKKDRGPYAANRTTQLLKAIYNFLKRERLYKGENPFEGIRLFDEQKRERVLSDDEAGRLLAALDEHDNINLRDFVLLDLATGARKDNLLSMKFEDIDWQHGTWRIPNTKSGKPQVIALSKRELSILQRRRGLHPGELYVFPGDGKTGHIVDFKRCWTTLRKRLGLLEGNTRLTIHDLRRSLAAGMASQNTDIAIVKGALGHADIKTTAAHYAHTTKKAQLEAREQVGARWQKAKKRAKKQPAEVIPLTQQKPKRKK